MNKRYRLKVAFLLTSMLLTGSNALADGVVVKGNVYGGGEVERVEWNTQVTIGEEGNTQKTPSVNGSATVNIQDE